MTKSANTYSVVTEDVVSTSTSTIIIDQNHYKRTASAPLVIPTYASACGTAAITSACSCLLTGTAPPSTTTIPTTVTVTSTVLFLPLTTFQITRSHALASSNVHSTDQHANLHRNHNNNRYRCYRKYRNSHVYLRSSRKCQHRSKLPQLLRLSKRGQQLRRGMPPLRACCPLLLLQPQFESLLLLWRDCSGGFPLLYWLGVILLRYRLQLLPTTRMRSSWIIWHTPREFIEIHVSEIYAPEIWRMTSQIINKIVHYKDGLSKTVYYSLDFPKKDTLTAVSLHQSYMLTPRLSSESHPFEAPISNEIIISINPNNLSLRSFTRRVSKLPQSQSDGYNCCSITSTS